MIRQKISRLISYTGAMSSVRKSFLGSMGLGFCYSFIKDPLTATKSYDKVYDLAVIGGGSGGLATAFEANEHGLDVIVIDYV